MVHADSGVHLYGGTTAAVQELAGFLDRRLSFHFKQELLQKKSQTLIHLYRGSVPLGAQLEHVVGVKLDMSDSLDLKESEFIDVLNAKVSF